MGHRIIELRLPFDYGNDELIFPTDGKAISLLIMPVVTRETVGDRSSEKISFRVAFEPENSQRKQQPFRHTMERKFPNEWDACQPWTSPDEE